MFLHNALHDGSLWLLLACFVIFAGTVIGLFTDKGSGISHHPYSKPEFGGQLASDLPAEAIGRVPAPRRSRR